MHPNFLPLRGLAVVLLFFGLTFFALAADKKRKPTEDAKSKTKAKPTQKATSKQQAKAARDSRQKKENRNKPQLAKQKKEADEKDKKRGKQADKLAKQREAKATDKARGNDKTAKRETEKKNDKAKDKLAKRDDKKSGKKKDEVATKKSSAEKDTKSGKAPTKAEIAVAKAKPNAKAKPEEKGKEIAKSENKSKSDAKTELRHETKAEEKTKELPASKLTLRPIAKVVPKVELKYGVARSTAGASLDVPPQDNGPDVIDVIEHDSPEAQRLDDLLRSEMKTLPYSGVPSVSRRKLDVRKMEAERIKQIQEALTKKGYYTGEITGQYDDATIEAMRKFQEANKIDVTGYTTAQSLRLLGLTDW